MPVAFAFAEGGANQLPVAEAVFIVTSAMTQEDQLLLPSIAMGMQPGMRVTYVRGDSAQSFPLALAPTAGDSMCGVVTTSTAAQWRLSGATDWVTFAVQDGGGGTLNWVPINSSSRAVFSWGPQFPVISTPGRFGFFVPATGWGCIRRITALLDTALTAGTISVVCIPSATGTGDPNETLTTTTPLAFTTDYAPYVAQIGDGVNGAYVQVAYSPDASMAGPSEIFCTVEMW